MLADRSGSDRYEAIRDPADTKRPSYHQLTKDTPRVSVSLWRSPSCGRAIASRAMRRATAPKVLELFREAGARWGFPAALLTDNGCVYTTWHRGGSSAMQTELLALGIASQG